MESASSISFILDEGLATEMSLETHLLISRALAALNLNTDSWLSMRNWSLWSSCILTLSFS